MEPSKVCVELLHRFEGYSPKAYVDPKTGGPPITIGFGFTYYADGSPVKLGDTMNKEQAEELLKIIMPKYYLPIFKKIPAKYMTQNRLDAATSWNFNLGVGRFNTASWPKLWAKGDIEGAANSMALWFSPGSSVEKGLKRRREAEKALFLK